MKKKYKLIAFDIDGTLTNEANSWKYLHENVATWEHNEVYKDFFLQNHITYFELCKIEANYFKGLKEEDVFGFYSEIELIKNIDNFFSSFKDMNLSLVAISSGLQFVPKILNLDFYFDKVFHNELVVKNGFLTGDIKINVENNKIETFGAYLKETEVDFHDIIFIGDGDNDSEIASLSGYSIAFNSKSKILKKNVNFIIDVFDHDCLRNHILSYLQGEIYE